MVAEALGCTFSYEVSRTPRWRSREEFASELHPEKTVSLRGPPDYATSARSLWLQKTMLGFPLLL